MLMGYYTDAETGATLGRAGARRRARQCAGGRLCLGLSLRWWSKAQPRDGVNGAGKLLLVGLLMCEAAARRVHRKILAARGRERGD
mgnify:CR=1 FL=1